MMLTAVTLKDSPAAAEALRTMTIPTEKLNADISAKTSPVCI
jgi:hypothetical protein